MVIARAPLTPLQMTELREQGSLLSDRLFTLAQEDKKLLTAMVTKLVGLDYRTTIVSVSLDRTRCSIELYHRSELALHHLEMMKLVRKRARALKLGVDTVAAENIQAHVDASLVPLNSWLFGALPGQEGVAPLPLDRLFHATFILQDLELARYSRTFNLT